MFAAMSYRSGIRALRVPLVALICSVLLSSVLATAAALAVPRSAVGDNGTTRPVYTRAPLPDEEELPLPPPEPGRPDTVRFGFYEVRGDGLKYAVRDGIWNWDHGAADPLEGWTSIDLTANDHDYWRWMTAAIWAAEGNPGSWPQMNASPGIALCGASEGRADTLNWVRGVGYGNEWCQRLTSPTLTYDGSGDVNLSLHYFNQTEAGYDYSKILVLSGTNQSSLNGNGFTGAIGIDGLGVITEQTFAHPITNAELGGGIGARSFTVRLEVRTDGGGSDQDGLAGFDSFYGALGVDDMLIDGTNLVPPVAQSFNFDAGLQGWTASSCPGAGSLMGINGVSNYVIMDPCACDLSGNILEFHNELYQHPGDNDPVFQHEIGSSCIVDRKTDLGDPAYLDYNRIMAEWDQYCDLPQENGVLYRAGWSYYPYENPNVPGLITWSPRVGNITFYYTGSTPVCFFSRDFGTDWGVPPTCEKVKFLYELKSSCNEFGIPPDQCSGITNATPLLDNVQVRMVSIPHAPAITFEPGCRFQDGFGQTSEGPLSPYSRGNANTAFDLRMGSGNPARLGDSLVVSGPPPASGQTNWEARLWFRVRRMGPVQGQIWDFLRWQRALTQAKGINFCDGPNPGYTWGYMDSCEAGTSVSKRLFCSQFRDGPSSGGLNRPADLNYNWGGGGEQAEGNEIIPDGVLTPGTQIQYFATSNYICEPGEYYYLPDTTGSYALEFEILPGYRSVAGEAKYPCILYVKAYPWGDEIIPHALNTVLTGAGPNDPIPNPASWDRYDYLDASGSWRATFYREAGGNSGATLEQLLGYRTIMIGTSSLGTGCTVRRDWQGIRDWMESGYCDGNLAAQGFLADGNDMGQLLSNTDPAFLTAKLGAQYICDNYAELNCPPGEMDNDENYCVRLEPVSGGPINPGIPVDLFGNWCPAQLRFDVLGTSGTGVGNQDYVKITTGTPTHYAQVVNDQLAGPYKYRSVVSGYSSLYLTTRDPEVAPDPREECPDDYLSRVGAVSAYLQSSLRWLLNLGNPQSIGFCVPAMGCGTTTNEVPEDNGGGSLVNRLYPNRPNPFNPRTSIRFSLASAGTAKLVIYDVTGREVRTLVNGPQTAGLHEVVWDGTRDDERALPSGVYWCRMTTAGFESNRRMIVLK